MVGRPSQRVGSDQEALREVREYSVGPPEGSGLAKSPARRVGRTSRRAGSGREAIPDGTEWLRGILGGLLMVAKQSQRAGSGREALPKGQE